RACAPPIARSSSTRRVASSRSRPGGQPGLRGLVLGIAAVLGVESPRIAAASARAPRSRFRECSGDPQDDRNILRSPNPATWISGASTRLRSADLATRLRARRRLGPLLCLHLFPGPALARLVPAEPRTLVVVRIERQDALEHADRLFGATEAPEAQRVA